MKIAGRDAGNYCVIVDQKDDRVVIDGQTRRRAVNVAHLEPLNQVVDIKKGATHEQVVAALEKLNIAVVEHRSRSKKNQKAVKK